MYDEDLSPFKVLDVCEQFLPCNTAKMKFKSLLIHFSLKSNMHDTILTNHKLWLTCMKWCVLPNVFSMLMGALQVSTLICIIKYLIIYLAFSSENKQNESRGKIIEEHMNIKTTAVCEANTYLFNKRFTMFGAFS